MKSTMYLLPLAGFVAAQDVCGPATVTETVTVLASPTPSAASVEPDITITLTIDTTTTVFVSVAAPTTLQTYVLATPSIALSAPESMIAAPSAIVPASSSAAVVVPIPTSEALAPSAVASSAVALSAAASSAVPSATPSTSPSSAGAVKGEVTFYGGNVAGGHCSFAGYTLPADIYGTAFGGTWDASECGACLSVTGPQGNSIKVMVVDQCPECAASHLDLFEDAFTQLGAASAGILQTSYTSVPCGITSPIVLKNKSGTSPNWFSMQVVNSDTAVSSLEVSTDGGSTWKPTTRMAYNFFEIESGTGTSTVDVKVTSVNGQTILVNGASTGDSASMTATKNFT